MKKLFFIFLFTTFSCGVIVAQPPQAVSKVGKITESIFRNPAGLFGGFTSTIDRRIGTVFGTNILRELRNPIIPQIKNGKQEKEDYPSIRFMSDFYKEKADALRFNMYKFEKMKEHINSFSEYGIINNVKPVIDSDSKSLERGFILEKHNVAPPNTPSVHEEHISDIQIEDVSQKWKEKLREKVLDKINKINKIESKGNFHMIYGYILKFNEDGEYCINYAA